MDLFGILTGIGGLALFLYGMHIMGESLAKLSGGKMESILERLTSTKFKAVLLGTLVTAVIQSSSATTVMVVGLVNSGIMQLKQAVGIIMGANIGTTVTSWLLSLTGISGSNIFIQMLKPSSFSPVLAFVGVILTMTSKTNERKQDIGTILLGFAILMFGMETMSDAVAPLASNEKFTSLLTMFSNPILGMIAGALLTAVIQSSSASIGILQALCLSGAVSYGSAIPIIMGQNIGTCVTALISSIGASKNAVRAAMIHLYFNLIGTIVFMLAFYGLNLFIHFQFLNDPASVFGVALIHSLFNIGCVILLYPFANRLVKLAIISVKGEKQKAKGLPARLAALDGRFLSNPSFAMELGKNAADAMAKESKACMDLTFALFHEYDEKIDLQIRNTEKRIDRYEDVLGSYLVKLSAQNLTKNDAQLLALLLHSVHDWERISDYALHITETMAEMEEKKLEFSSTASQEIFVLVKAVQDIVNRTMSVFIDQDLEQAKRIEPLEEVIDGLNLALRQKHIQRFCHGQCPVELDIYLEDTIIDLERIADHCSNIAICLIQVDQDALDLHEYLDENIRQSPWFIQEVKKWKQLYSLSADKEGI